MFDKEIFDLRGIVRETLPEFFNDAGDLKIDVLDKKDSFEILADLPGVDKKNIDVAFENNVLTISAKKEKTTDKEKVYLICERDEHKALDFKRSLRFAGYVSLNEKEVKAEFKDGVLKINIQKKEEPKRKIEVI